MLFPSLVDPRMKSTCAEPHMSWYQALLVLMTDMISEGSGDHVRLCNLVRVSLLTNIKFEVDENQLIIAQLSPFHVFAWKELSTNSSLPLIAIENIKKILDLRNSCNNMKSVGCYTRKPVVNVLHTVCKDEHVYPTLLLSVRLIDPLATSKFSRLN